MPTFKVQTWKKVKSVSKTNKQRSRSRKRGLKEQSVVANNRGQPLRKAGSVLKVAEDQTGTAERLLY